MDKLKPLREGFNSYTFPFDVALLDELKTAYRDSIYDLTHSSNNQSIFEGGKAYCQALNDDYFLMSYKKFPLLWFSSNSSKTYQLFQRFFEQLNIDSDVKNLVDYDQRIVLYCGFFVLSNRSPYHHWHVDYQKGANAFTLITPLFKLDDNHGHLSYRDRESNQYIYKYRTGEAIIFGDGFTHATEVYSPTKSVRVLASLTFGTDKIEYWEILKQTLAAQSNYTMLPCGHVRGTCDCLKTVQNS